LSDFARLDFLPSAGTSLLDYKRGVSVARSGGGWEAVRGGTEFERSERERVRALCPHPQNRVLWNC
jgi:hypothetical protein